MVVGRIVDNLLQNKLGSNLDLLEVGDSLKSVAPEPLLYGVHHSAHLKVGVTII